VIKTIADVADEEDEKHVLNMTHLKVAIFNVEYCYFAISFRVVGP